MHGVEEVPERVCNNKEGALLVGHFAQLGEVANTTLVALQPDREDMAHVGRHFHAVRDEDAFMLLAEWTEVPRLPHTVVLGDVHPGKANATRLFDEVVGVEHRVRSALRSVQVHVDDGARHRRLLIVQSFTSFQQYIIARPRAASTSQTSPQRGPKG